jgi:hypothetical protein
MNKYKLVIVFWNNYNQSTINQFYKSLNYFKKLTPENSKLTILDLTAFSMKRINNNYIHNDSEVNYLKISNIRELIKVKKNFKNFKKIYALGPIYSDFKSILIFLILRWLNISIIFINYFGYYLKEKNVSNHSTTYKLKRFFLLKFSYFLSRICSLISIFPDIEYYFETSQERIYNMKNTFFKKILDKISIFNHSGLNKIVRINSVYYDRIKTLSNNDLKQDFIVFVDSGFDHPDRLKFEKIKNQIEHDLKRKNYFENLYKFIKSLEATYQKKIIFCQHPKTDYSSNKYFKKIQNEFETINGQSDEFIEKGEIIVFTGASSMVNKAIILKKKILYAVSTSLGRHISDKILSFNQTINLPLIDLDKFNYLDKQEINLQIIESIKLYDEFINNNLISKKNIYSYEQIIETLYK